MQCHNAEDWRHQWHCCEGLQTRPVTSLQLHQQNTHYILIHIHTILLLNVSVCLPPTSGRTSHSLLKTICFYKATVWGTVVASQNIKHTVFWQWLKYLLHAILYVTDFNPLQLKSSIYSVFVCVCLWTAAVILYYTGLWQYMFTVLQIVLGSIRV